MVSAQGTDTPEVKLRLRRALYEKQLQELPPRGPFYITYGGDARRALRVLLEAHSGSGEHYVYLHRGPTDEVFYVGKGKGDRAYSTARQPQWHHYVKTRCHSHYEVEIVRHFDTEDAALELESDLIALFGSRTVNAMNPSRGIDLAANARFHKLRKANWARITAAVGILESRPEDAELGLLRAIADMAEYARINWEQGLFAELSSELYPHWGCHLNSQDLSALNKLTLLHKAQGRWRDLIMVIDSFFDTYPETLTQGLAQQIMKHLDAAKKKSPQPNLA